jgi:hypothetical protein
MYPETIESNTGIHRLIVAVVLPSPVGFFSLLLYDSPFLYQSGTNLEDGFGEYSEGTPKTSVNVILIFVSFRKLYHTTTKTTKY